MMAITSSGPSNALGLLSVLTTFTLLIGREVAYHSGRAGRTELRRLDILLGALVVLAIVIVVERFVLLSR
jgi:hypothetical protein